MATIKDLEKRVKKLEEKVSNQEKIIKKLLALSNMMKDMGYKVPE